VGLRETAVAGAARVEAAGAQSASLAINAGARSRIAVRRGGLARGMPRLRDETCVDQTPSYRRQDHGILYFSIRAEGSVDRIGPWSHSSLLRPSDACSGSLQIGDRETSIFLYKALI
jgi:hypothetical protein